MWTHRYRVRVVQTMAAAAVTVGLWMGGAAAGAQHFGLPLMKSKVTLQRKLPAVMQLPGTAVKISVSSHGGPEYLAQDFESMLGAELQRDDPRLRIENSDADSLIECQITEFDHPAPTVTVRPGIQTGRTVPPDVAYTRVTGTMRVSFKVRKDSGATLGQDDIVAQYDQEFDTSGNAVSGGLLGGMKNSFKRVTGGAKSENMNPPTDAELRNDLMNDAVQQIARQLVTTRETIEVLLAKGKGMDDGVKDAEAGLWSRALEAWETAPALPRPVDDAYRLYDIGVAYEAMGYAADDVQIAMRFLDQASINYGKAIDSDPAEKYFLEPQKRIETALAHYEKLQEEAKRHPGSRSGSGR